jgi:hypothetical protein
VMPEIWQIVGGKSDFQFQFWIVTLGVCWNVELVFN